MVNPSSFWILAYWLDGSCEWQEAGCHVSEKDVCDSAGRFSFWVKRWKCSRSPSWTTFLLSWMHARTKKSCVIKWRRGSYEASWFYFIFLTGTDWWLVADSDELQSLAELEVFWVVFGSVWRWMGLNDKSDLETSLLCCMHVEIVTISSETISESKN